MITIKKGLKLPIQGGLLENIDLTSDIKTIETQKVAILGSDYHNLKATFKVEIGDKVAKGQTIFVDKKDEKIAFVSPIAGTISEINRGDKRVLLSVVIENDNSNNEIDFKKNDDLNNLSNEEIREKLLLSGLWTSFRTRPFDKIPSSNATCEAIFITAIDTHPLSLNPRLVIENQKGDFRFGLQILAKLNKVYLCQDDKNDLIENLENVEIAKFAGVHPAGLAGTHIHFLKPVSLNRSVWHLNYQDVIAIGKLFKTGKLDATRFISIAGAVKKPQIVKTILGASVEELTKDNLLNEHTRLISGSVFGGTTANNEVAYLGKYHLQISCIEEETNREFLYYLRAGVDKHSILNIVASKFNKNKLFNFTTSLNGSYRAMIPVGNYEEVMPLDILATQLLRSLVVNDLEMAEKLGVLELAEEDVSLLSYVCAGKYEYAPILRSVLNQIEKENS